MIAKVPVNFTGKLTRNLLQVHSGVFTATAMLKLLGSEVPRSTAVLCTDPLVARPRGTKIRREVVLIRVLNSLGGIGYFSSTR